MKRYFDNYELKMSSMILVILTTFFLLLTSIELKVQHNNLKEAYIKSLGAISARITEKNPALEKEIIPLITKEITNAEGIKGKELLAKYGLTKNLEDSLFPNIKATMKNSNIVIIFVFISMAGVFFILNYLQYGFIYERIRRLAIGAKKVVDGEYDIAINEDREGDFSKLALSFNSMRKIIRSNLESLNEEKQFLVDLLSDISHQLKTPLSSMIVYNDIMLTKELPLEKRNTFLINNQNQLQKMSWLIKNILKLARLDAKAIEFIKENQSLNETIQDCIDSLESKALEGKVKITYEEEEEVIFAHDKLWLEEALINIIKNGIEHTPKGGEIKLNLFENPIYRKIIIEDTGEGIKEEDLPNIFMRFYKVRTLKKSESIGIGLALSKAIIEAHNGMIEVHSIIGKGTKFIITFLKY
jgi:signal transduction histidine kinase